MFARFHHDAQDHQQAEESLLVVAHTFDGLEEHEQHFEHFQD